MSDEPKTNENEDPKAKNPEEGSPGAATNVEHDERIDRIEQGKDKKVNINPLAPPVNIQGGS